MEVVAGTSFVSAERLCEVLNPNKYISELSEFKYSKGEVVEKEEFFNELKEFCENNNLNFKTIIPSEQDGLKYPSYSISNEIYTICILSGPETMDIYQVLFIRNDGDEV